MKWVALIAAAAVLSFGGGVYLLALGPTTTPAGAGIGSCLGNGIVLAVNAVVLWRSERRRRPS